MTKKNKATFMRISKATLKQLSRMKRKSNIRKGFKESYSELIRRLLKKRWASLQRYKIEVLK